MTSGMVPSGRVGRAFKWLVGGMLMLGAVGKAILKLLSGRS